MMPQSELQPVSNDSRQQTDTAGKPPNTSTPESRLDHDQRLAQDELHDEAKRARENGASTPRDLKRSTPPTIDDHEHSARRVAFDEKITVHEYTPEPQPEPKKKPIRRVASLGGRKADLMGARWQWSYLVCYQGAETEWIPHTKLIGRGIPELIKIFDQKYPRPKVPSQLGAAVQDVVIPVEYVAETKDGGVRGYYRLQQDGAHAGSTAPTTTGREMEGSVIQKRGTEGETVEEEHTV